MIRKVRTTIILQTQIEAAMKVTRSNRAAAKYLRVSFDLYKRYAKAYKNEQGISLYDLHKNQSGKGVSKLPSRDTRATLEQIFNGEFPSYPKHRLLSRMISNNVIQERCNSCGFCTRRESDTRVPLILNFVDGNQKNYSRANLEALCYNCYFLHVGNLFKKDLKDVATVAPELFGDPSQATAEAKARGDDLQDDIHDLLSDDEKMSLIDSLRKL